MIYKLLMTELLCGKLLRTGRWTHCFPNNHVPVLVVQQDVKFFFFFLSSVPRLLFPSQYNTQASGHNTVHSDVIGYKGTVNSQACLLVRWYHWHASARHTRVMQLLHVLIIIAVFSKRNLVPKCNDMPSKLHLFSVSMCPYLL